eukprot:ANDGO_03005.mRNA.1 hypothetical protein SAMD00019534_057660
MTDSGVQVENGIVVLNYADLVSKKDLTASIGQAYGPDGLGILVVRGVPGFQEKRQALLPLARDFVNLPQAEIEKCVKRDALFQLGYSRGVETLDGGKSMDWAKGSYYANPIYDEPSSDAEEMAKNPTIALPNVWPSESLPQLEFAFKDLGKLIVDTGVLVAEQCDLYVASLHRNFRSMKNTIQTSRGCKARLLYYFPAASADSKMNENWCQEHTDHGALTGLCPAMFFDESGQQTDKFVDEKAGLFIRDRHGNFHKGRIPLDCLAFQIGESSQILSGGMLRATPHAVRASQTHKLFSRSTFAVFMQPWITDKLDAPENVDPKDIAIGQWTAGQTFAEFMAATVHYTHGAYM